MTRNREEPTCDLMADRHAYRDGEAWHTTPLAVKYATFHLGNRTITRTAYVPESSIPNKCETCDGTCLVAVCDCDEYEESK